VVAGSDIDFEYALQVLGPGHRRSVLCIGLGLVIGRLAGLG
jgi:hypothetical protein